MRGMDDRAAANQRAIDALFQARRRAVTDCRDKLTPGVIFEDQPMADAPEFAVADAWDRLSVDYLRAEWPPSMLN